jgi:hypothetical protein
MERKSLILDGSEPGIDHTNIAEIHVAKVLSDLVFTNATGVHFCQSDPPWDNIDFKLRGTLEHNVGVDTVERHIGLRI